MSELEKPPKQGQMLTWLWLSALVFVLDQGSKYVIEQSLSYMQQVEVLPIFDLILVYNAGAAFSFMADAGGWQRWLFVGLALIISCVLVIWIYKLKRCERIEAIALALVLGGAAGNLCDRILLGHVIDFISVHYQHHYFPSFNIADSAISIGAAILIFDMFRHKNNCKNKIGEN